MTRARFAPARPEPRGRERARRPPSARRPAARALLLAALAGCSRPGGEPTAARDHSAAPSSPLAPATDAPAANAPAANAPAADAPAADAPALAAPALAAPAAGPPRPGCEGLFDPPEGAAKLCDEHVLAGRGEIHWTSWAVTTSRADTFRPYHARASACGAGATFKPPILSVSKGDARLSIHDKGESSYPSCATKPGPAHASVVIISIKHDR